MKHIAILALLVCMFVFYPQRAHAQNGPEDQVFTVFNCIPGSCADSVGPITQGNATVVVHAECNTGIAFNVSAQTIIGAGAPCSSPFTAENDAKKVRRELLDDCDFPFFLDSLQLNEAVTNSSGTIVFHQSQESSCDGGDGAPTVFGTMPC